MSGERLAGGVDLSYPNGMTVDQLRRYHRAEPFHPFDIYLADGRSLHVGHQECLAINEPGRTIGVALSDGTIETVDLLLVVSLKPRSNGRQRRVR